MIDYELRNAHKDIMDAVRAEDVFGAINDGLPLTQQYEALDRGYWKLMQIVNPADYNSDPDAKEFADEACERLEEFYTAAYQRLELGTYGQRPVSSGVKAALFATAQRQYFIDQRQPLAEGSFATIYGGECVAGDTFAGRVAIKIANDPADNAFLLNELRVLEEFQKNPAAQHKHLPRLLDHFRTEQGQLGIIMRLLDQYYDLYSVRDVFTRGVGSKHMAWMLNRALSAIGYVHSLGRIHGNIDPSHLMVRECDHNMAMLDWTTSILYHPHSETFKVYNEPFSAPEVKNKGVVSPAADIYSISKCMVFVLGGDVQTNEMPDSVEDELQSLLCAMTLESPHQRSQDAWQLHGYLDNLVRQLWGPKEFLPFSMQAQAAQNRQAL